MRTILETDSDFVCDIQAPCFQMLIPEEAEMVRASKIQVLFRKDDNLTKQGAFSSYILFIISCYAKQYLEGEGTRNFNLRIIKPGEFVGLSAVFSGNTFTYSSVAITDCQVFLVEKEAIAKVAKENGKFGFQIIKRYSEQNANLLEIINSLIHKQMNGRLSEILLYIDSLKKDKEEIFQLLSRKELADFAGISTESTVKILKSFEKDRLIELHEKDIKILNYETLKEISRKG
jgi:CRP/FNR family transcriptional regulator